MAVLFLIEPLELAGLDVVDLDGLTGLAEYRNGGLMLDLGLVALKDPADRTRVHTVDSPLVVGWRALTVALLDKVAERVRAKLGLDAVSLPLAAVLEGGTWAAGRRIAAALRRAADRRSPSRATARCSDALTLCGRAAPVGPFGAPDEALRSGIISARGFVWRDRVGTG